jgi:hypothetical protein
MYNSLIPQIPLEVKLFFEGTSVEKFKELQHRARCLISKRHATKGRKTPQHIGKKINAHYTHILLRNKALSADKNLGGGLGIKEKLLQLLDHGTGNDRAVLTLRLCENASRG